MEVHFYDSVPVRPRAGGFGHASPAAAGGTGRPASRRTQRDCLLTMNSAADIARVTRARDRWSCHRRAGRLVEAGQCRGELPVWVARVARVCRVARGRGVSRGRGVTRSPGGSRRCMWPGRATGQQHGAEGGDSAAAVGRLDQVGERFAASVVRWPSALSVPNSGSGGKRLRRRIWRRAWPTGAVPWLAERDPD